MSIDIAEKDLAEKLSQLSAQYLLDPNFGKTPECLEEKTINDLSEFPRNMIPENQEAHMKDCFRCTSLYSCYRSVACIDQLPERFSIKLEGIKLPTFEESEEIYQNLGIIRLDTLEFHADCENQSWQSHPMYMRTNLIMDLFSDLYALTIIDVPNRINTLTLRTPRGWEKMKPTEPEGCFEIFTEISKYGKEGYIRGGYKKLMEHINKSLPLFFRTNE